MNSGVIGINWNIHAKKWGVCVFHDKKCFYVGLFKELDEAKEAQYNASQQINKEENNQ